MTERLPYEEQLSQQWNDLPLPDENMAWADMKRRLDEDDAKPLLPFWLRGCAGWGLLGIFLLGIGWWIARPDKWFKKKEGSPQINTVNEKTTAKNDSAFNLSDTITTTANKSNDTRNDSIEIIINKVKTSDSLEKIADNIDKPLKNNNDKVEKPPVIASRKKNKNKQPVRREEGKTIGKNQTVILISDKDQDKKKQQADSVTTTKQPKIAGTDSTINNVRTIVKRDSLQRSTTDSIKQKEDIVKEPKKDSTKKKTFLFSAGVGLQQQLPVAGQKFFPYNSQGRKGTLADYVPSVYLRMTRPEKWFIQTEFRYGAPQYTKEFLFRQESVSDTGANPRFKIITSSTLKKTYYHQLPLTFNYFVMPGWSVGTGIQWNKFASAVSEREVLYHNNLNQSDSVLSKSIFTLKKDTAFKRSYLQAVIETQYQWRRFSFGARYSFGLQPYINFTQPGGTRQQEKNSALQIFLRYRLWKSKEK